MFESEFGCNYFTFDAGTETCALFAGIWGTATPEVEDRPLFVSGELDCLFTARKATYCTIK